MCFISVFEIEKSIFSFRIIYLNVSYRPKSWCTVSFRTCVMKYGCSMLFCSITFIEYVKFNESRPTCRHVPGLCSHYHRSMTSLALSMKGCFWKHIFCKQLQLKWLLIAPLFECRAYTLGRMQSCEARIDVIFPLKIQCIIKLRH